MGRLSVFMTYNTAKNSNKTKVAQELLLDRVKRGQAERDRLVQQVAAQHIFDRLVLPHRKVFHTVKGVITLNYQGLDETREHQSVGVHPHAFGQLCSIVSMPQRYASSLKGKAEWADELLDVNLNTLYAYHPRERAGRPVQYLHRIVNGELRGVLSNRFARHLASMPMLRAFVTSCEQAGAQPIEATTSPLRFSLKSFLPHVFEPVPGEFVSFGVCWGNSDFGAGPLHVSSSVMRISSGSTLVMDDVMNRVHLGSIIQESEIDISEETRTKEIQALQSAINDAVTAQLAPEVVNKQLELIEAAHEEQVPWSRLKVALKKVLVAKEVENVKDMLDTGAHDIIDLPPAGKDDSGQPIATKWWASNVVSHLAMRDPNLDRREQLQFLAGELLGVKR